MKTLLDVFLRCPECRRNAKMFQAFTDRLVKTIKTKTPTSAPVSSTAEATAAATADTAAQESAQVEAPEGEDRAEMAGWDGSWRTAQRRFVGGFSYWYALRE